MRLALLVTPVAVAALTGCTGPTSTAPVRVPAQPPPAGTPWIIASGAARTPGTPSSAPPANAPLAQNKTTGTFLPAPAGTRAITYDPAVVPPGAQAEVTTETTTQGVRVRLTVRGMVPRRAYGAHLHTMSCTSVPDDAGPHYQHDIDPSKPSVNPVYANPQNEVWLDFTADRNGAASVASGRDRAFDPVRPPRSLVIHAERTRTKEGEAGTAGPRVACLTLSA